MPRFIFALLLLLAGLSSAAVAAPADGMPARPVPFTFVTDQANLLKAGEAKKLDSGLRKYADNTGTQVVVVTVPSLNGTDVADYGRQLGTAWGVGQRGKNNGIVVLLSGKEHKMTIQAGEGLQSVITPEVTSRIINQEMTPAFKQGNYFAGLRKGLSSLMLAANPGSDPRKNQTAARAAAAGTGATPSGNTNLTTGTPDMTTQTPAEAQAAAPESSGIGLGTILIGVVVIGGGIWLISRLFKRNNAGSNQTPNFTGNNPGNPTPNFGAPNGGYQQGYPQQGGYGSAPNSGPGIGGMLATGAAAAAGAYIGNRMASGGHDSDAGSRNFDTNSGLGAGAAAAGTGAAGDYFAGRDGGSSSSDAGPDYFADNASADNSGDYFSTDNSSYDDSSSDDTGGGGFDSTDNNSGSW